MLNAARGLLIVSLLSGCAAESTVDESPTYVMPGQLIESDNKIFLLELRPAQRWEWPRYPGESRVVLRISAGTEFAEADPLVDADDSSPDEPQLPYTVIVGPVIAPAQAVGPATSPEAWSSADGGVEWTLAVDFSVAGDWTIPLQIADVAGHRDGVRLVFRIVPEPVGDRVPPP